MNNSEKILKSISNCRLIPEGGTESLSVKGCTEILRPQDSKFDVICSSVGTGGTIAGLITASYKKQFILGFNALNSSSALNLVNQYTKKKNWGITNDFTFGGYGKIKLELINFMNNFYKQYKIVD